jgi:hypothetical protein
VERGDALDGRGERRRKSAPREPLEARLFERGSFTGEVTKILAFVAEDGSTFVSADRKLRGRVVLYRDRALVVEVEVGLPPPLDWSLVGEVTVAFASGLAVVATVDRDGSTAAGATVAPGASARLAIVLPEGAPADAVVAIAFVMDGDLLLVEV